MLDLAASEALTLAAITYRGMLLAGPPSYKSAKLRKLMDESMATFSAVKDKWRIVWGPANFSPTAVGFDDDLMYVAQRISDPSVLAIAIRGTNTVSLSDWVFGDLLVDWQVPWPYDAAAKQAGAMISASTALGLSILQHLRWKQAPAAGAGPAPSPPQAPAGPQTVEDWVKAVRTRLLGASRDIKLRFSRLTTFADWKFDPIAMLEGDSPRSQPADGNTLKDFLTQHTDTHRNAEIIVIGHSKGGALSTTMALWLADTRGPRSDPAEQWNRAGDAGVSAWSFAGPTAGNEQFARHSDRKLAGQSCRRIWNTSDIVPYAFLSDKLPTFPDHTDLSGPGKVLLRLLLEEIAHGTSALNYRQVSGGGEQFDGKLVPASPFPVQLAHQHLDAYLENFKLNKEMCFTRLIAPG